MSKSAALQLFFILWALPALLFSQEATRIRLLPHWVFQSQFAGYIVAIEKGYYQQYGLDIEIIPGGPGKPVMQALAQDEADIAIGFLSSAIKSRAGGMEVVSLAQIGQRSALMFVAKKGRGIQTPRDFNGKRLGIWYSDFQELPMAFLTKYGIECEIIPVHSTINMFLWDAIDIMCIMWYNEYHQIINAGLNEDEIVIFDFVEHGLNFPEDGLFCMQDWLDKNPRAAQDFIKATISGWQYAFQYPDEALNLVMTYMKKHYVPANNSHQQWMLSRMKDIIMPGRTEIRTHLLQSDYHRTAKALFDAGSIQQIPAYRDFFKGE